MIKITNYRNIGICAHIDAGKTSLTERILFYTGKNHNIGEVHNGESTMDWMDQERERGITICSAVTTVFWSGIFNKLEINKINIIDTPGHIDFTAEVERSLRVLDSVCLVICSVGGIQPQTEQIWNQIKKHSIPTIGFINKMDRQGANYISIYNKIYNQLGIKPLLLNVPYYDNGKFTGIVDLITLKKYIYNNINGITVVETNCTITDNIINYRNKLIDLALESEDYYIEKYLNDKLSNTDIISLIRKKTISCTVLPLLCGSALKNKGIQNLLDSIINYLPSPHNYNNTLLKNINSKLLVAFIFKIINDPYTGLIYYIRIYSGKLSLGDIVLNTRTNMQCKIIKIYEVYANKKIELNEACIGNIVAITGLVNTISGDTICHLSLNIKLEPIYFSNPVISVSISPIKLSDSNLLFSTIKSLLLEDPTLKFNIDKLTGNAIVSGMGELHIEVFMERVKRITNIKFNINAPSILYRETIKTSIHNIEGKYIKQSGGKGQYGHVILNAILINVSSNIEIYDLTKGGIIPNDYIKIIINSLKTFSLKGFCKGGLIVGIKFEIIGGSYHEVDSTDIAFKLATFNALKLIFDKAGISILEPIMLLNVYTNKNYLGIIVSDISSRKGTIINIISNDDNVTITAKCPLSTLFRYSTIIRSLSKGRATFTSSFNCYSVII